jgi:hypothetical protein
MTELKGIFIAGVLAITSSSMHAQTAAPNPFAKGGATSTQGNVAGARLPAPLLPIVSRTTPPASAKSLLPPLVLPPPLPTKQRAPVATLPGDGGNNPVSEKSADTSQGGASPFMSREDIDAQRALCSMSMTGSSVRPVPSQDSDVTLHFKRISGQNCLLAVSVDDPWVDAQLDVISDEVRLSIQENGGTSARATWVNVVAGVQSFKVKVRQAGNSSEKVLEPSRVPAKDLAKQEMSD